MLDRLDQLNTLEMLWMENGRSVAGMEQLAVAAVHGIPSWFGSTPASAGM